MPTRATYTPFYEDLPQHKQTMQLQQALEGLGMPAKWSHLCYAFIPRLNTWCLAHNEGSPDISALSARQIADICGWPEPRKAEAFKAALGQAGFLDIDADGRVAVHNLSHYLKPLLSGRARQQAYRDRLKAGARGQESGVSGGAADAARHAKENINEPFLQTPPDTHALRNAPRDETRNTPRNASRDASRPKVEVKEKDSKDGNGRLSKSTAETAAAPVTSNGNGERPAPAAPGSDGTPERPAKKAARAPDPKVAAEAERMRRWTVFGTMLRNWGVGEQNVRRLLKWVGKRNGGVSRDLDIGFAFNVLGTVKGLQNLPKEARDAAMAKSKVEDMVALTISIFTAKPSFMPNDENYRLAKMGWAATEKELAGAPPEWLAAALQEAGVRGGAPGGAPSV